MRIIGAVVTSDPNGGARSIIYIRSTVIKHFFTTRYDDSTGNFVFINDVLPFLIAGLCYKDSFWFFLIDRGNLNYVQSYVSYIIQIDCLLAIKVR